MFGKQLTLLGHKGSVLLLEREECLLLTGSIAEADFEFFFRPAGATRCTDGAKIWHGAAIRVYRTPKTEIFTEI